MELKTPQLPKDVQEEILLRSSISSVINYCRQSIATSRFCSSRLFWTRYLKERLIHTPHRRILSEIVEVDSANILRLFIKLGGSLPPEGRDAERLIIDILESRAFKVLTVVLARLAPDTNKFTNLAATFKKGTLQYSENEMEILASIILKYLKYLPDSRSIQDIFEFYPEIILRLFPVINVYGYSFLLVRLSEALEHQDTLRVSKLRFLLDRSLSTIQRGIAIQTMIPTGEIRHRLVYQYLLKLLNRYPVYWANISPFKQQILTRLAEESDLPVLESIIGRQQ